MASARSAGKGKREEKEENSPKPLLRGDARAAADVLLFLYAVFAIYVSIASPAMNTIERWVFVLVALAGAGMAITRINGLPGGAGMYLLGTKRGVGFIDKVSRRYQGFWRELSIWGVVIGLGLLSWPLLKGKINRGTFALGLIAILVFYVVFFPCLQITLQFITLQQIQNAAGGVQLGCPYLGGYSLVGYAFGAISLLTGLVGYFVMLLFYNAGLIIVGTGQFVASAAAGSPQTGLLVNQLPGVAPLIPGVDIPLVAGIASLIILLILHELSHGILARIEKIKVKKVGLVLFGIIPMGAFVEPDEDAILKLPVEKQNRIIAAGISTNFLLTVIFFIMFVAVLTYLLPGIYANAVLIKSVYQGYPANGILQPGMQIVAWNGYPIKNLSSFTVAAANDTPGKLITVTTPNKTYSFTAISVDNSTRGLIGVDVYQPYQTGAYSSIVYFLFTLFGLSFLLNLAVAVGNMLPVPMFDGWRIYQQNMKNKRNVKLLAALVGIALLINVLPLIYYAVLR